MNCNEELSYRILTKLTTIYPELNVDMKKQLEIKHQIDDEIYQYNITSKCVALTTGDVAEKVQFYILCKKMKGLSDKTLKGYLRFLQHFADCMLKPVCHIDQNDIRRFIFDLSSKNKPSTLNNKIIILNDFFKFLQNEEFIIKNPMANIPKVKEPKRKRKALTIEEQELMRKACKTARQRAIFEFFISTGCRVSEVANVKINDINWSDRTLYVIGKGNKERMVKFSTKCKIELEEYLQDRQSTSTYLFASERFPFNKMSTRAIQDEIKRIKDNSSVQSNVFCHKLRHTFATTGVNAGVSLPVLQAFMGHSSPATTQIYYEVSSVLLNNEYNKISH